MGNLPKGLVVVAGVPILLCLVALAYSRPGYFTSEIYMGGLIGLELLALALWRFRQVYFALLMYIFLSAGSGLPGGSVGTKARWVFLAVGAVVGTLITLKEGHFRINFFRLISLSCALAALTSAAASRYPDVAVLKALSLFLLFLYAASITRTALIARETRFLEGLVTGCEILVAGIGAFYAVGIAVMGNPNSLGAVMGVAGIPLLLWGMLTSKNTFKSRRRLLVFLLCAYLVYHSHARAAILASIVSSALLCLALRQYKMLMQGVGLIIILTASAAIFQPQALSSSVSGFTSDVVYKGFQERGVLASRESPWNEAMNSISSHFWFGTGFGTKDAVLGSSLTTLSFASNSVAGEYGSSYLALLVWVGVIGALPFLLLLVLLVDKIVRTFRWMRFTGSALHPAVPFALVVVAGLVHAGFEDWMFAVGYYLCVFFWSMAFLLVDLAPEPYRGASLSLHSSSRPWQSTRQILVSGAELGQPLG